MARIEDTLIQESIADSLLGPEAQQPAQPEQEESQYAVAGDDLLNEAIAEQESSPFNFDQERAERVSHLRREPESETQQPQERLRSERSQESEQQQQPHAPTPEEVQAGVEKLDSAVKEYGLNEPADARTFADEFTAAFGSDVFRSGVDIGALGNVMSKTALSALQVYDATKGDLSKMGEIPMQNAQAFAYDLLKGMGLDPRSMNVDAMLLAQTTLGGMVNFLNTYQSYGGKVTDLARLNSPEQAEFYMQNFMKALGVEAQVNREAAIKFADACAKQLLRVMGKIGQASAASQPRGKAQRGQRIPAQYREGIKGSRVPKFRSNSDIFSGEAVEAAMSQKL